MEHDPIVPDLFATPAGRGTWDIWETLGVSLLLAAVLVAVGDTAAGLLTAGAQVQVNQNEVTLLYATQWASPYIALFPLAALGATWWRIRAWSRRVTAPGESADPLPRSMAVASAAIAVLVVTALAAIGAAVSTLLLIHASTAPGNQVWPSGAETLAESSAAVVLCGAGIAAAVGLLRQVRGSFGDDLDLDVEGAGEARDEEITPALT